MTILSSQDHRIGFSLLCVALVLFQLPASAGERPADETISIYVKEALRHDERVDAAQITVSVKQGIVTLAGEVDNLAVRNFADQEAKKINGVSGVVNELAVKPAWRLDTDIAHAIKRRILNNADIDSQGIKVTVANGKATLDGTVASYSERQHAAVLAAETVGVTEIENNLNATFKSSRSDHAIKGDIVAAFGRDVYLSGQDIVVAVNDGAVTLTGTVGNAYEKDKAKADVWTVANVKSVDDKLEVVWWDKRGTRDQIGHHTASDSELRTAVMEELKQDDRINADNIIVKASFGHVTLDGSVHSHYQRRTAEQDVRDVIGVGWVTNNLFTEVDKRADRFVQDDIAFNLYTDFTLQGFDLKPRVKDGVVTLSGEVHNWYEKSHARDLASNVKGVRKVISKISVHYAVSKPDSQLAKDIERRLLWNWTTLPTHNDINVTVNNGIAKLTGDVDTWAERNTAATVAFKTDGIWRVDNRLTVNGYDYRWDDWFYSGPYDYNPYYDAFGYWPYYYDNRFQIW